MFSKKILFCSCVLLALLVAPVTYAQGLGGAAGIVDSIAQKSGADSYKDPQQLIGVGINAALTMVGLIFLILMIYAGYLWLTARGEEEPINKAQKIIISSVIGFILVASAYAVTMFVGKRFETGKAVVPEDVCPEGWSCGEVLDCFADHVSELTEADKAKDNLTIDEFHKLCEGYSAFCKINMCKGGNNIICCKQVEEGDDEEE